MITTQRLLLIVIAMNIVIGMATAIYQNPSLYDSSQLSTEKALYEQYGENFKDDDEFASVKKSNYLAETSIGNSISWGKILLDIFLGGINPFSISSSDFSTDAEQLVADLLGIFRSMMWVLLIIEIIMFFKNKKNS